VAVDVMMKLLTTVAVLAIDTFVATVSSKLRLFGRKEKEG
jgi:hypothetical protein